MEDKIISLRWTSCDRRRHDARAKGFAIAMRAPDGTIVVHKEGLAAVYRSRITKIHFCAARFCCGMHGTRMRALTLFQRTHSRAKRNQKLEGPRALYYACHLARAWSLVFLPITAGVGGLAEHYLDGVHWR